MPGSKAARRRRFNRLAGEVTREYENRGFSPKRARYIGRATAAKVARQRDKKGGK